MELQALGGGMNGGTVLVQTTWIGGCPLIYTHAELGGVHRCMWRQKKARLCLVVVGFCFFFLSSADLGCAARSVPVWHMLCVHPVAKFIPEARLQNLVLVQSDFVLLPNKEQARCLFSKSKIHCEKQHNTALGLRGLNIKQPAEPKGKISGSALALNQPISITIFPARHAAYDQCLLLMKAVTFLWCGRQMEPLNGLVWRSANWTINLPSVSRLIFSLNWPKTVSQNEGCLEMVFAQCGWTQRLWPGFLG